MVNLFACDFKLNPTTIGQVLCKSTFLHSFARYASAARMYSTLLHLISTSPKLPVSWPSTNSSAFAKCKFM